MLHVDHIIPVADGGQNDIENLTTSCSGCNHGKGATPLTALPDTVQSRADLLAEREAQEKEFAKLLKARRKRQEKQVDAIQAAIFPEGKYGFADKFRVSVRGFLDKMPMDAVLNAAELAALRISDREARLRYFCGICWRTIKKDGWRYAGA